MISLVGVLVCCYGLFLSWFMCWCFCVFVHFVVHVLVCWCVVVFCSVSGFFEGWVWASGFVLPPKSVGRGVQVLGWMKLQVPYPNCMREMLTMKPPSEFAGLLCTVRWLSMGRRTPSLA